MKYFFPLVLIAMIVSCHSGDHDAEDLSATDSLSAEPEKKDRMSGCYQKIVGRDTALLQLEFHEGRLAGKMMFDNYEKDGSRGTVKGTEENDIIHLWYDFQSEGMHSVMEIYFKKEDHKLIRGIGNMDVKGDTAYYTDPNTIDYSASQTFDIIDCMFAKTRL